MAWALAVALIFCSITLFFVFMYSTLGRPREQQDEQGNIYLADDEHKFIRLGFLGMVGAFILYLLGFIKAIVSASKITDSSMLTIIDSMAVVVQSVVFLFLAYLMIYTLYYLINKVLKNSDTFRRRIK